MSDEQKLAYYGQVEQVARTDNTQSTNDNFIKAKITPNGIEDLVKGNYVSAGFNPTGADRFGEVKHNAYNFLPLLDSFHGADYAETGKNTVGDLTFRRNAYELLAYQGYDVMISYISNQYDSDAAVYQALLSKFGSKTSTLIGKLEITPEDTKIARYKELLAPPLQAAFESIRVQLFSDEKLKEAIQKDLAVITNNQYSDITKVGLTNNVRNLKMAFYSAMIQKMEETANIRTDRSARPFYTVQEAKQKVESKQQSKAELEAQQKSEAER